MSYEVPSRKSDYYKIVGPIFYKVSIHEGPDKFLKQFARLSEPEKHLLATHWCQSEISNGGLTQFYMNSTGVLCPEAATGFEAIGLLDAAHIVRHASGIFGRPYQRHKHRRNAVLDRFDDMHPIWHAFADLDEAFYASLRSAGGYQKVADIYARIMTQGPGRHPDN